MPIQLRWRETDKEHLARISLPLFAAIGAMISGYLTYVRWQHTELICAEFSDCDLVNTSVYSEVYGVPVALLGLIAYAGLFSLGAVNLSGRWRFRRWTDYSIFTIATAGLLFSAWLTYVELFILDAICIWCVCSAMTITAIFVASAALVRTSRLD